MCPWIILSTDNNAVVQDRLQAGRKKSSSRWGAFISSGFPKGPCVKGLHPCWVLLLGSRNPKTQDLVGRVLIIVSMSLEGRREAEFHGSFFFPLSQQRSGVYYTTCPPPDVLAQTIVHRLELPKGAALDHPDYFRFLYGTIKLTSQEVTSGYENIRGELSQQSTLQ